MLEPIIHDYWLNTLSSEDYELYLHSPFCVKACRYCVYTGKLISEPDYAEAYQKYVHTYLPAAIKNYEDIFKLKTPSSFYFGGGTPNMIKAKDLADTFDLIPGFDKIPCKISDVHPAYVNNNILNTYRDYGFSTLCFGIQSFDEKTLKKNNRDGVSLDKFRSILRKVKDCGMYTSIDLMCYLHHYGESDLSILKKDLDIALSLDLDFIAINPNLHFILSDRRYISIFEHFVDRYLKDFKQYVSEKELYNSSSLNNRAIYRIVNKKSVDRYRTEILPYFADDFPYAYNNIIGIGDLNNQHSTMSYIHHRLFYVEKNIKWEPTYDIKYIKQSSATEALAAMLSKI